MDNAYDFYKPDPSKFLFQLINIIESEYPIVDGHLSVNVYLNALAKTQLLH